MQDIMSTLCREESFQFYICGAASKRVQAKTKTWYFVASKLNDSSTICYFHGYMKELLLQVLVFLMDVLHQTPHVLCRVSRNKCTYYFQFDFSCPTRNYSLGK